MAGDEMSHLGETIHYYHDGIILTTSLWQTKDKIHANMLPWLVRDMQWRIQPCLLLVSFINLTNSASVNYGVHIPSQLWPIKTINHNHKSFIIPKMPN